MQHRHPKRRQRFNLLSRTVTGEKQQREQGGKGKTGKIHDDSLVVKNDENARQAGYMLGLRGRYSQNSKPVQQPGSPLKMKTLVHHRAALDIRPQRFQPC